MSASPPPCVVCDTKPVKRKFGSASDRRGNRVIEGVRWRWYCSSSCASQDRAFTPAQMRKVSIGNVRSCERRILQRLVAACKDHVDERGRVDPKDFVRVMMTELRKQYQRQYAMVRRGRRMAA